MLVSPSVPTPVACSCVSFGISGSPRSTTAPGDVAVPAAGCAGCEAGGPTGDDTGVPTCEDTGASAWPGATGAMGVAVISVVMSGLAGALFVAIGRGSHRISRGPRVGI